MMFNDEKEKVKIKVSDAVSSDLNF